MKYTGAKIIVETLVEQGVDTVFGYPGGAVLNIYDELYKARKKLIIILRAMSRVLHIAQMDMLVQQVKQV